MNRKEVAPVTQQRLGSTEPGIPDLNRIGEQVGALWDDYAYALVAGAGVLVVVTVVTAVVKVARSRQRDRVVGGLTAVVVLAWTSEGLWEVARFTLGLPLGFAVMTFFVYEAMMLTCALQAERHRKRHPSPGPAGRYVWVLAAITATVVALNAQTPVEALLRLTLPLAAAGLWWVGITAERDDDPDEVKQLREAERKRRETIWAISWRRLLVAVGVMRPGAQTLTEAERERRIRQMVTAADKLQSARPGSRRAEQALQRLRRLARLASANDIAAVRARVARTTRIAELVMPATDPAATGDHLPAPVPHHPGNGHASPAGLPVSARTAVLHLEQHPKSWLERHRFTRTRQRVFRETAPLP
jgi:NADH:ubiquinone oxidoreductase subunit 6 (subunit J)